MKFLNLLFLCWSPALLAGQQLYPLIITTDSIHFSVVEKDYRLALHVESITGQFKSRNDFLSVESVELTDADLIIEYKASGIKEGFAYEIEACLLDGPEGGQLVILPGPAYASGPKTKQEDETIRRLNWEDFGEKTVLYGQRYTLLIRKALLGAFTCSDERPEFGWKKQWPHFAGAGAGIALIGLGQVYRRQKENDYEAYLRFHREGLPEEQAQPFWEEAEKKDQTVKILTYIGLALLGADAITFGGRYLNSKKQQKLFDRYCKGLSLDISPSYFGPNGSTRDLFSNCTLVWTF